jgi:hypothetical protein
VYVALSWLLTYVEKVRRKERIDLSERLLVGFGNRKLVWGEKLEPLGGSSAVSNPHRPKSSQKW